MSPSPVYGAPLRARPRHIAAWCGGSPRVSAVLATLAVALVFGTHARAEGGPAPAPLHAALLPLDAPDLLPNVRDELDDDVRAGLTRLGVDVQAREVTLRSVRDAAGAGLDCTLTSADCAIRVGLVAEVQAVVTVSITSVADRLVLHGALLDVNQVVAPRRVAAVEVLPGIDGGKSLAEHESLVMNAE